MQRASDSWPWLSSGLTQRQADGGEKRSGGPSEESRWHTWWRLTEGKAHAGSARSLFMGIFRGAVSTMARCPKTAQWP